MLNVNCVSPPAVIVITSEPLKVIAVFASPSPVILSNCISPALVKSESLKSNVPVTSRLPSTVTLPAKVALAPLPVSMVVEPDLTIRLPLELVKAAYCVPSSLSTTSASPASKVISAAASTVRLFAEIVRSVPSPSIFSLSPPKTIPTLFGT